MFKTQKWSKQKKKKGDLSFVIIAMHYSLSNTQPDVPSSFGSDRRRRGQTTYPHHMRLID